VSLLFLLRRSFLSALSDKNRVICCDINIFIAAATREAKRGRERMENRERERKESHSKPKGTNIK
jgi:hypothetical protein